MVTLTFLHGLELVKFFQDAIVEALKSAKRAAMRKVSMTSLVKDIDGKDVSFLSKFYRKALLIVNVASKCGLTSSNYSELSHIYEKYKTQDANGVLEEWRNYHNKVGHLPIAISVVLPSPPHYTRLALTMPWSDKIENALVGVLIMPKDLRFWLFLATGSRWSSPGSNSEIKQFACTRCKAEFPIFDKDKGVDDPGFPKQAKPVFRSFRGALELQSLLGHLNRQHVNILVILSSEVEENSKDIQKLLAA
ncbi:hypothetical protein IFM89_003938 [Coptis chinensis]|uniref:Glutathione peroxidase n=1 Tax=Coptis chinensis TaxID=261450 RepID=A0A835LTD7_9MAGN|nr:hypothetical protein IFM89_003938 [Coptis chinensis]